MQQKQILLTLLVGDKQEEGKTNEAIQALHHLAQEFATKIAEWDEESPLTELENYYPAAFMDAAKAVQDSFDHVDEATEQALMSGLIDEALQWELLQYDDSVLSLMFGEALPEDVADEHFNTLVRRHPDWALALAEEMGEDDEPCACCQHDGHHHDHHDACEGHCHHHHE